MFWVSFFVCFVSFVVNPLHGTWLILFIARSVPIQRWGSVQNGKNRSARERRERTSEQRTTCEEFRSHLEASSIVQCENVDRNPRIASHRWR